jgi:hypothetical protein
METIVYTNQQDRSSWPAGPWDNEPEDKIQWLDEETKLPCLVVRGLKGAWCGYVGVTAEHPDFGKNLNDVDVDVHGGLAFASFCQPGPDGKAICHIVENEEKIYWFGFDCCHYMDDCHYIDEVPGLRRYFGANVTYKTYKPLAYVKQEVTKLARQLKGTLK